MAKRLFNLPMDFSVSLSTMIALATMTATSFGFIYRLEGKVSQNEAVQEQKNVALRDAIAVQDLHATAQYKALIDSIEKNAEWTRNDISELRRIVIGRPVVLSRESSSRREREAPN